MAASKDFSLIFNIGGKLNSTFSGALGKVTKKLEGIEKKAKSVGKVMSAMSAVGFAGLGIAVNEAIKFESAMADVKKVFTGTTQEFEALNKEILEMSTRLPMTAEDITKIAAAAGQSGIATKEISKFTEDAVKMGVAFDITAEEAGQAMAEMRSAFRIGQKDVVVLADKINHLGNNSPAAAKAILAITQRVGPLGEVAGFASGSIAALGATMRGMGVQEEIAATGIQNMMLSLVAGENATKSQHNAMVKLGLNSKQVAKNMQKDAEGTTLGILRAVSKLEKFEQAATLQSLFGKESIKSIAPLLTNMALLEKNFKMVGDATQYAGSMEAEYQARAATTENQIILAKNSVNALAIEIGSTLLPHVNKALTSFMEIIKTVREWRNNNQELAGKLTKVAIVCLSVVGALGAVAVGVWALAGPLRLLITLLKSMAWLTKGAFTVLLMLGKGLLFVGRAALWASGKLLMFVLRGIGMLAKGAVFVAIKTLTLLGKALLFVGRMALISGRFMLANPIILAITVIVGLIYLLYKNWDKVSKFISDSWVSIKAAFGTGVEWIKTKFSSVMEWFASLPSKFSEFGKNMIQGLINGISNMAGAAVEKAKAVASSIANAVKGFFGINSPSKLFMQFGEWNMQGLANGMQAQAPQTANTAQTALGGVLPSVSPQQASQGLGGGNNTATLTLTQEIHIAAGTSEEQAKSIADQSFKQFESRYNSMMNKRQRVAY